MATDPGKKTHYTVYSDESALNERYFGFGGIFASSPHVYEAQHILGEFCHQNGFSDRSLSWKACSPREIERYCAFAQLFDMLCDEIPPVDFRAMVVDTHANPLKHPASGANTEEKGFYRFYHGFLEASLRVVAANPEGFRLVIAPRSDRYLFNAEILEKTVGGSLRGEFGVPLAVTEINAADPRQSRIHQLSDVLLGAVTYRFNRATRDPAGSSHKVKLYETVREIAGRDLDEDFLPNERPFNVWGWAPRGGARWVKGAGGVV